MVWTAETTSANQKIQIGAESTSALGTAVAAGKVLECFDITLGIDGDVNFYTSTGHKYPTTQEENTEFVSGTLAGHLDYNGVTYIAASVFGSQAVAGHGSSSTAKDWIYTPPLTGSVVPQTYTLQQGDAVRARQTAYMLFTEFGYKAMRKGDVTASGKFVGLPLTDGITLTSSPTTIASSPVVGKHWNVYLDTTSAGLGTTQLVRCFSIDYLFTNVYGTFFPLNRANLGFTAHVDLVPKATIKLKLEANVEGITNPLAALQAGTTYYLRVQAQGPQIAADGPGAVYATYQHDMAIKFGKPTAFQDEQGVYALEWECTVVEDPTWGKSQVITITNLIAAL
jgi:hypothetical protein